MEDLLDVSRISSGNITLQMDDIDLVELVRQTGGEFNEKLEQKGLNVISKFPKEAVMIYADGRQLWRVIGNLMCIRDSNAGAGQIQNDFSLMICDQLPDLGSGAGTGQGDVEFAIL